MDTRRNSGKATAFLSDEERAQNKVQSVSNLVIDIGARSAEEAKEAFGIRIGEPAVPATPFEYDEARDIMFGKGFDCRIGCAALIETMRLLSGMELDVDVIGVLSAQEEVGERGCKVAVNKVRPNIAIVYEGCPADDTFGEAYAMQTIMKKAPCSATWTNLLYATPASSVLRLIRQRKRPYGAGVRARRRRQQRGRYTGAACRRAQHSYGRSRALYSRPKLHNHLYRL